MTRLRLAKRSEESGNSLLSRRETIRRLGLLITSATGAAGLTSACTPTDDIEPGATPPSDMPQTGHQPLDANFGPALGQDHAETVPIGGARDGTTNDRQAFETADSVAQGHRKPIFLSAGVYRVAGTITIKAPVIVQTGAIIKPDNGTVFTMAGGVYAGQHQFIDMTSEGVVVVQNVAAYHPAWWGPIGTDNDTATWASMLVSASYVPTGQVIHVPAGETRLWELEIRNVHLEGFGRTRKILPAIDVARAGDPKKGTGFIVNLAGRTTVNGIDFETDDVEGITAVFWTGSRVWMTGGRVKPFGLNTIGIWACTLSDGSITPKMTNMWVEGNSSGDSGIGIRYESHDGEMTNVTVGYCSTGIELLRGSSVLTAVHVFECTENGIAGLSADHTRFVACYIEKNGQWGVDFTNTSYVTVDAGTRLWSNGLAGDEFGGARFQGNGDSETVDNRVEAQFNDNSGCGLLLDGAHRTTGDILLVSYLAKRGEHAAGSTGLYITSRSHDTDIRVRGPRSNGERFSTAPVSGPIVVDEHEPG